METDGSYVLQALGATEEEARENIRISMGRHTTKKNMEAFVKVICSIAEKYSTQKQKTTTP
jgi:cysteine sulfinate desulfinase/cysteine desulfurase-like protein